MRGQTSQYARSDLAHWIIAFIGLMLSPITWWNDPFVNIPISYLAASVIAHFSPKLFSISFLLFYWLTNVIGMFLLYIGGEGLIKTKISGGKQIVTVIIYSVIILVLSICGIIRPIIAPR